MDAVWIRAAHAGREIKQHTGVEPPKPHAIYRAVLDGRIPAEFKSNAWWVRRSDLPAVAAVFGIDWPKAKPARATINAA